MLCGGISARVYDTEARVVAAEAVGALQDYIL
jgi:hypothetical protein